jgi:hypothetical protein
MILVAAAAGFIGAGNKLAVNSGVCLHDGCACPVEQNLPDSTKYPFQEIST